METDIGAVTNGEAKGNQRRTQKCCHQIDKSYGGENAISNRKLNAAVTFLGKKADILQNLDIQYWIGRNQVNLSRKFWIRTILQVIWKLRYRHAST